MRRIGSLAVILLCLFSASAFAEVAIETSLSRSTVAVGEEVVLDFIVTNADGPISRPTFPPLDGFTSYSQGHSQEINIVNGRTSSKSIFSYVLIPNSAGHKQIGPFEITINGKVFKVAPVDIDVTQTGLYQAPVPTQTLQQAPVSAPSARALPQGAVGDQDIFVRAWLDKDEVYVNEPAMLTYTLYTRLSATYKGFDKEPVTTGFWVEDFPPAKTIKRTEQVINGSRYVVADVRKMALFPTEAGIYSLDPGTLSAMVEVQNDDSFNSFFSYNIFGRRSSPFPQPFMSQIIQKVLPTDKLTLTAKALPAENKPASFTGAVGHYQIDSSIDKDDVEAGTPVTFRVRITGEGNINTVQTPSLPKLDDFKIYDSSTSTNVSKERLIVEGEKTTETVIVPKKAGTFTVPPLQFSYFDPDAKTYKTIRTVAHTLTVKPSTEPEEAESGTQGKGVEPVEKEAFAVLAKDIRYIKTAPMGAPVFPEPLDREPFYWGLDGLLVLLTALFTVLADARRDAHRDEKAFRSRSSHKIARKRLHAAAAMMRQGNRDRFYSETSKAVYGYFADRLGLPPQSVTLETIEARAADAAPALLNDARSLFNELGRGRYGSAEYGQDELRDIYEKAEAILSAFEKVKMQ